MAQEEIVILVDNNDNVIGQKYRKDLTSSDIVRISSVWITDELDRILIAQRSLTKKSNPGKWGPAVAGTHSIGDTYESNAHREAEEEIGVKDLKFLKQHKYLYTANNVLRPVVVFHARIDSKTQLKLQEEEVAQIKWFTKQELLEKLESEPEKFVESVKYYLNVF